MNKTSLTRALLVAGSLAVAGIGAAQADAIFYPDGRVVELGLTGADNLALSGSMDATTLAMDPSLDTTALGAGPATTTTTTVTTVPVTESVYIQPNIDFDPNAARAQLRHRSDVAMPTSRYVFSY